MARHLAQRRLEWASGDCYRAFCYVDEMFYSKDFFISRDEPSEELFHFVLSAAEFVAPGHTTIAIAVVAHKM
ncbi:hypothetical protein J6590_100867 [Homalodisca vitripennis]|nr:hypothetical protein J6590_100867 [Homalodisca vitripennis]